MQRRHHETKNIKDQFLLFGFWFVLNTGGDLQSRHVRFFNFSWTRIDSMLHVTHISWIHYVLHKRKPMQETSDEFRRLWTKRNLFQSPVRPSTRFNFRLTGVFCPSCRFNEVLVISERSDQITTLICCLMLSASARQVRVHEGRPFIGCRSKTNSRRSEQQTTNIREVNGINKCTAQWGQIHRIQILLVYNQIRTSELVLKHHSSFVRHLYSPLVLSSFALQYLYTYSYLSFL